MIKKAIMVPLQGEAKISPFPPDDLERNLLWYGENGFTGVEPVLYDPFAVDAQKIKKLFEHYNLETTTLVTGQSEGGFSLSSEEPEIRKKTIERMLKYIEFAAEMESMVTIGLIKGTCIEEKINDSLMYLRESMEKLLKEADRLGVTLLLEPINHTKAAFLNSSTEVKDYIETYFKGSSLKILWDSFQANIEDYSVPDVLDDICLYLGHVHFADSNRKFPGLGNINFQAIYQKLYNIKYSGYITLECYNKPSGRYILEHAKELFEKLESGLKK